MQTFKRKSFKDQMGRSVTINYPPLKIISLVPSQTELLFDLGLDEEVVGITKFCVHPDNWFKTKTRVGGTKQYNLELIKRLQPDLIIGNKEENDELQIQELMQQFPVWMSDIKTLHDAIDMIESVGELVDRKYEATEIKLKIEYGFSSSKEKVNLLFNQSRNRNLITTNHKPTALYLIWYKPLMAAGADTFINEMLHYCGFENACIHLQRYPQIDQKKLVEINPEIILLSSEPFPFKQKHIDEMKLICPNSKVILVDGEYFSWYGSRLINAPIYFESVINEILN